MQNIASAQRGVVHMRQGITRFGFVWSTAAATEAWSSSSRFTTASLLSTGKDPRPTAARGMFESVRPWRPPRLCLGDMDSDLDLGACGDANRVEVGGSKTEAGLIGGVAPPKPWASSSAAAKAPPTERDRAFCLGGGGGFARVSITGAAVCLARSRHQRSTLGFAARESRGSPAEKIKEKGFGDDRADWRHPRVPHASRGRLLRVEMDAYEQEYEQPEG